MGLGACNRSRGKAAGMWKGRTAGFPRTGIAQAMVIAASIADGATHDPSLRGGEACAAIKGSDVTAAG